MYTHAGSRYFVVAPAGQGLFSMARVIQTSQSSQCLCLTFDFYLVFGSLRVIVLTTDHGALSVWNKENGK